MRQNTINNLNAEKGMALVMVLMIVTLSAGLLAVVMYFAMTGGETSALQRKYQSSKEASLGAADIVTKEIIPRALFIGDSTTGGLGTITTSFNTILGIVPAVPGVTNKCFYKKLTKTASGSPDSWSTDANCPSETVSDRLDPTKNPDITFNLLSVTGGSKTYRVDVKIIDTLTGNSDLSGVILEGGGVVNMGGGNIAIRHFPYLYTIASEGKLQNSTTERANLEFLYAY